MSDYALSNYHPPSFAAGIVLGFLAHDDNAEVLENMLSNLGSEFTPADQERAAKLAFTRAAGFDLLGELEEWLAGLDRTKDPFRSIDWLAVYSQLVDLVAVRNQVESPIDGSPLKR